MDLRANLLKEHSKKSTDAIVRYIGKDKRRFAELMNLFFENEYRLTQRAAWPMSYCVQKYPELIKPHLRKLIRYLKKPGIHQAVVRNTVRLLQDIEIPKSLHGEVMTTCFDYVQSADSPAAIKAFSLTVLKNLSLKYPEIRQELKLIIEERWDQESAAFRSRAKSILSSP